MVGTAKDEVRKMLDELPDDSSWEEIQRHIHAPEKMESRLRRGSNPNHLLIAFGVAMLLHLVAAGFSRRYTFYDGAILLQQRTGAAPRLTLDRYPAGPQVVENPAAPPQARPPERARMASDRNAPARDHAPRNLPKADLPHSPGQVADAYNLTSGEGGAPSAGVRKPSKPVEPPKEGQGEVRVIPDDRTPDRGRDFASYLKQGEERARERDANGEGGARGPRFRNEKGGAMADGDLSFSTYAWDYVPYMLRLKALIESHMFPPPAFSMYGLIDGKNMVRFRIGRDGKLLGMEVLGFEGNKLLVETSTQALELSNPFPPLPPDFPDANLEVTGQFRYDLIRERR